MLSVDNLLTGRESNIAHLRNDSRFEFALHDINEPFDFGPVDYVFHFASPASPVDYSVHGIETLKVGSLGTTHALEVAQKYGAKFLVSSTSECYGDPLEHPQKETYWGNVNPIGRRSVYDEAKRFIEALTMAFHRYLKVDTRIARIFNTYGPRMQIDGFLRLSRSSEHLPVNIGNPNEFSILECALLVKEIIQSSSKIVYESLPQDDPRQRRPDISKARGLLGWEPKTDLKTGLRLSLEFFQSVVTEEFKSRAVA